MVLNLIFTVLLYCAYATLTWGLRIAQIIAFNKILPKAANVAIRTLIKQPVNLQMALDKAPKRSLIVMGVSIAISLSLWLSSAIILFNIWK